MEFLSDPSFPRWQDISQIQWLRKSTNVNRSKILWNRIRFFHGNCRELFQTNYWRFVWAEVSHNRICLRHLKNFLSINCFRRKIESRRWMRFRSLSRKETQERQGLWGEWTMLQFHRQPHCLRARSYLCPFKWNKKPLNDRIQLDEMICIISTLAGYRFLRKWQDNIHSDGILPSNDVDRENGRSSIRGRHRNGSCHAKTRSVQTCGDCSFSA